MTFVKQMKKNKILIRFLATKNILRLRLGNAETCGIQPTDFTIPLLVHLCTVQVQDGTASRD